MSGCHMYGIGNCDTVKKARRWCAEHGIGIEFHDFKREGIDVVRLDRWLARVGWEVLLNRRGITWRRLDEGRRAGIDEAGARQLMLEMPTIVKRPVLECGERLEVGFSDARYRELFGL